MSGAACVIIIDSATASTKANMIGSLIQNGHISDQGLLQSLHEGVSKINSELDDLIEKIGESDE